MPWKKQIEMYNLPTLSILFDKDLPFGTTNFFLEFEVDGTRD